ncbi:MAG: tripartite tricarboxylate transporter TctB family protein [Pseudomonadota bacterium]
MADTTKARAVAWGDLAFAGIVIAAAGVVWFGTADLPPPRYEPVGSAALPRGIATIMAILSVFVAVRAVRAKASGPGARQSLAGPVRVLALAVLLVAFVAVMDARLVGFRPAAAIFLVGTCLTLGGFSWRRLGAYTGFSLILAIGLHAIFTRLFYIDLP